MSEGHRGIGHTAIGNITSLWVKPSQLFAMQHTRAGMLTACERELHPRHQNCSWERRAKCFPEAFPFVSHTQTLPRVPWLRHLSHEHHCYPSRNSKRPAAVHYTGDARTQGLGSVPRKLGNISGTQHPRGSSPPCNPTEELYYPSKKLVRHYNSLLEGEQPQLQWNKWRPVCKVSLPQRGANSSGLA